MTYAELRRMHKVKSELSDLTAGEREIYDAFLELGESKPDLRILGDAWLTAVIKTLEPSHGSRSARRSRGRLRH